MLEKNQNLPIQEGVQHGPYLPIDSDNVYLQIEHQFNQQRMAVDRAIESSDFNSGNAVNLYSTIGRQSLRNHYLIKTPTDG
jgi:hypothetical protein